ncbi:MAG: DUF1501 domain-containing protein [Planctomycetes bacterium]|nr:DUF1501 domain-containing protein [Planctomycetota bacterium]
MRHDGGHDDPRCAELHAALTRRAFLGASGLGLGALALASLAPGARGAASAEEGRSEPGRAAPPGPHFPPRVKRVIHLHMAGAPSQLDLFDPKPALADLAGKPIPASFTQGERFAFIKGTPRVLASPYRFARHGASGHEFSELLPHIASIADELTVVRSMQTREFNHAPAQLFLHTGHARSGRPSLGAWASYGLGTMNADLPAFVVLLSGQFGPDAGASVYGAGFLPTVHQGVRLRSEGEPVLFLDDPSGMDRAARRRTLDALAELNRRAAERAPDPEIDTRIAQYELAYRMQASVPELADLASEPEAVRVAYGAEPGKVSFANNCLLARRLVERGVRFVQLYHWGWDSHGTGTHDDLVTSLPQRCRETDQATAALIRDLGERGLLDDTLVVWGGEFGRTPMNEERDGSKFLGRDHHPHAFTMLFAGAGVKRGLRLGATDELGYRVVEDPVTVHDLNATLLHLLGFEHTRLTYRSQGRDFRLTDVEGEVVRKLLA